MARYPVVVMSPFLEQNLPNLLPNFNPWPGTRRWMQKELDIASEIGDADLSETTWCVPNPEGIVYDDGHVTKIDDLDRDKIRNFNTANKEHMARVKRQEREIVQSWEVTLQGTIDIMDNRILHFLFNLFTFAVTIVLSFFGDTFDSSVFQIVVLGLMIPQSALTALRSPLLLGQLLKLLIRTYLKRFRA